MKKIVMFVIFVLCAFIFSVLLGGALLNAETVVKEQLDGSFLVKERTERAIAYLPALPDGLDLDPNKPEDAKVMIQLWNKSFSEIIIRDQSYKKIVGLFPPIQKTFIPFKKVNLTSNGWQVEILPEIETEKEVDIDFAWVLFAVVIGIFVSINNNQMFFGNFSNTVTFFNLGIMVILGYVIVFWEAGGNQLMWQYLALTLVAQTVSFVIAVIMKKMRNNREFKKEFGKMSNPGGPSWFV